MTDEEIEVLVDTAIKKGFKSPTRGWVMAKILKQFDDPLDQKYAREYIINDVCNTQ